MIITSGALNMEQSCHSVMLADGKSGEDTLIYAFDQDILRAGDVNERVQWCLQRRKRATGRVLFTATDQA